MILRHLADGTTIRLVAAISGSELGTQKLILTHDAKHLLMVDRMPSMAELKCDSAVAITTLVQSTDLADEIHQGILLRVLLRQPIEVGALGEAGNLKQLVQGV